MQAAEFILRSRAVSRLSSCLSGYHTYSVVCQLPSMIVGLLYRIRQHFTSSISELEKSVPRTPLDIFREPLFGHFFGSSIDQLTPKV